MKQEKQHTHRKHYCEPLRHTERERERERERDRERERERERVLILLLACHISGLYSRPRLPGCVCGCDLAWGLGICPERANGLGVYLELGRGLWVRERLTGTWCPGLVGAALAGAVLPSVRSARDLPWAMRIKQVYGSGRD